MPKKSRKKVKGPHGIPYDWEALSTHIEAGVHVGLLTLTEASLIAQFAHEIENLIIRAKCDPDSLAVEQLKAVHKILRPDLYKLPAAKIEELAAKYNGTPAHNRASELRRIMWRIAHALEPIKPDANNILDGPVKMIPVERVEWRPGEQAALHAEVERYWKPGVTLESLAIRIYIDERHREGKEEIDAAHLRADLRALAEWEKRNRPDHGAAAKPTAPLWRLLATPGGPMNWKAWIKEIRQDSAAEREAKKEEKFASPRRKAS